MVHRFRSTILASLALVTAFSTIVPATATHAATAAPGGGQALEIAPPVLNLVADPGTQVTAQISLRDVSTSSLRVTNEINDFTAAGEDGTPKILLDSDEPTPYSLKPWISPIAPLTLKSREIKNIAVTIKVPADASPGGYYGVIRFSAAAAGLEGNGVSLSASLGALVLLRVNGAATEKLSVAGFFGEQNGRQATLFKSTPIKFVQRIKNEGNVFEQPAGLVTITDMFGKKVATLGVNQPPRNILPNSVRRFEVPLDNSVIGNKMLFGRYKADLVMTYGANKQTITSSFTFWVIPYRLIATIIILLVGGFFVLRTMIRRYNRSIIRRAQGSSKTKSKSKRR